MTGGCTDKRFAQLLYAYELGMLDESDRAALELHLLDCEYCFARAEKFAPAAELLRESQSVRKVFGERPVRGTVSRPTVRERTSASGSSWGAVVRLSLVVAAVLVVLILRPWQLEFRSTHEAVAGENRLVITTFENLSDPDDPGRLGEIVAHLLIADLSESRFLQVVSSQRVRDISRLLGQSESAGVSPDLATEIASRASAQRLLTGTVSESGEGLRVWSELADVGSGVVIASQEVMGAAGESVFELVDRLTEQVRADMSLPEEARSEADRPVAEVTTSSRDAFQCYLEGLEYVERLYRREAVEAFEKAIEYDSTFAMAYYYLAMFKDRALVDRAVEYSGGASWVEQKYILAYAAELDDDPQEMISQLRQIIDRYPDEKEAYYRLGLYHWQQNELDSAGYFLQRAIDIDPLYRNAYNNLTYVYSERRDFANAIGTINQYISLAPGEANPYDTRGDLYASNGDPQMAIESYLQALKIKPDFSASAFKLAAIYIMLARYAEADSLLAALKHSPDVSTRTLAHYYQPMVLIHQGRFTAALVAIDSAAAAVKQDLLAAGTGEGERASFHRLKAGIYAEIENLDLALAEIDSAIAIIRRSLPDDSITFGYIRAHYLAQKGDFAGADNIRRKLTAHFDATGEAPCYRYWAAGGIELARGNPAGAAEELEKAAALTSIVSDFQTNYQLARSYLEADQLGKAVELFQRLSSIYYSGRLTNPIDDVKLHYYLGMAYEKSRWKDRAAQEYQTFLDLWKYADPGLESVSDARRRLARLES